MRKLPSFLATFAALLLAACAAPAAAPEHASADRPASASQATAMKSGSVVLDKSCKTDADCAVKDVGNCCGYYPACLNKDSPTDPAGVRAQCQSQGMAGVCGFPSISACQCNNGQCASAGNGVLPIGGPTPAPNPVK